MCFLLHFACFIGWMNWVLLDGGWIEYAMSLHAAQGAEKGGRSMCRKRNADGDDAAGFFCAKNIQKKLV